MASTWFLDIPLKRLIVVLASQSPRRNAILKQLGIEPIVEVSGYDEKMDEIKVSAEEFVKDCSMNKARMVAERLKKQNQEFDLIVGCDTVIEMNGEIFGKPKDEEDAMRMLRMFSGRSHTCITGVTLINQHSKEDIFAEKTTVEFGDISETVLQNYIATGEYKGCAGGYRIQSKAGAFVRSINGCYNNVVGLPSFSLVEHMQAFLANK